MSVAIEPMPKGFPGATRRAAPMNFFSRVLLLMLLGGVLGGCSSHRFELANRSRREIVPPVPQPAPVVEAAAIPPYPQNPPVVVIDPNSAATRVVPPAAASSALATTTPAAVEVNPAVVATRPLPANPNAGETSPRNRRRVTETPRPGPPGSLLTLANDGPELFGRVVDDVGRPVPRASVQLLDLSQGGRLVAEVATGGDGTFRVINLRQGTQYEVVGASSDAGQRFTGSTVAVAPDTSVVVQLDRQNSRLPRADTVAENLGRPLVARGTLSASPPLLSGSASPIAQGNVTGNLTVVTPRMIVPPASSNIPGVPNFEPMGNRAPVQPYSPTQGQPAQYYTPADLEPLGPTSSRPSPVKTSARTSVPRQETGPLVTFVSRPRFEESAFVGTPLEKLQLLGADLEPFPLRKLDGDLFLLDFFGGWCGPCRAAIPGLRRLHQTYADQGLRLVGIACEYGNTSKAAARVRGLQQELHIDYTVLASPLEQTCPVRDYFRVQRYPTLVLVDRRGQIHFHATGGDAATLARLELVIQQQLSIQRLRP